MSTTPLAAALRQPMPRLLSALTVAVLLSAGLFQTARALVLPPAPSLGAAVSFAVVAGAQIAVSGSGTTINGDVGIAPAFATSITGIPGSGTVTPPFANHGNDAFAIAARASVNALYTDIGNLIDAVPIGPSLNGLSLGPGLYTFGGAATNLAAGNPLVLNGPGVFIFQATSSLITDTGSTVVLNNVDPCQVFWRVVSQATLNGDYLPGNVVANANPGVVLGVGAVLDGRALTTVPGGVTFAGTNKVGGCSGSAATLAKSFTPASIQSGGQSNLVLTLSNPTGSAITGASLSDVLPAGVTFTGTPSTTCAFTGTFTNTAGSVNLTGATIPTTGCTVSGPVTSTVVGDHVNTAYLNGTITAEATLTVGNVNEIRVHVLKYINGAQATSGSAGGSLFQMTASGNAANLGGAWGPSGYQLGNHYGSAAALYGADTAPMSVPADYTTSETIGGIVLAPTAPCVAGFYQLLGYSTSTTSFADAATQPLVASVAYTGLTADRWVIVKNRTCPPAPTTGTLVVNKTTTGGMGTFDFTSPGLSPASFSITNSGTRTFNNVAPGPYTITEAPKAGWNQSAGSCTVTVVAGQTATCNFTNTKTIAVTPAPRLEIAKTVNTATYDHAGQVITYTYAVRNTGNVALTGPFKVTDDKLGTFTCGSSSTILAVNQSVTCTKTYTVQATDLCGSTSWQQGKTATIDTGPWLAFTASTQDTKITNHQGGLPNGTYPCWCIQAYVPTDLHGGPAKLFSTLGTGLPADVSRKPWNKVNWVLNNKGTGSGPNFLKSVQTALWRLTGELNPEWGLHYGTSDALVNGANANSTYVPGPGGISAVIVYSDGMLAFPKYANQIQESICEVKKCTKTIVNKAKASVVFKSATVTSNQVSVTVSAK